MNPMKTLSVTEAKPRLGKLVDRALRDEAVFIRRGRRIVQIVPAVQPDPLPVLRQGALTMTDERVDAINAMPGDARPLER
jgi:antitoxin (DNA-binding transcriptional repressor) of toxin-antitoxin stability system